MKPPFWATLFTALGVLILCSLGTWQVQRLAWKNNLIDKLNRAYETEEAAPLDLENITNQEFTYGRVSGIFMPDKALLLGPRTMNKEIGHDLLVPLKTQNRTLIVNMGWTGAPLDKQPIYHLQGKKVWFEGLARTPKWNSFTPENRPEQNAWYKADIEEIAQAKNLDAPYPFILRAEHASHKFDAAFPNNPRLLPNNNHLQYAFFWFAMAAALMGVYTLRFIVRK
ncbi:MAG: SURF1 family protein [Alphaproteobacteria bacterium]